MFLSDNDQEAVRQRLERMKNPVKLIHFTQELECQFCRETRGVLQEISQLSDQLSLEVYNFQIDKEKASQYVVDKIPATVIEGNKDYGIRIYGVPFGYEFAALLDVVVLVSRGESGLKPETLEVLEELVRPVHLQVFVTPTCPYCSIAVRLAHQMTLASDLVTADMVEATEFPQLVYRYGVRGVPHTVINEDASITGAMPERDFVARIVGSSLST
jgi:glutaredoxin-like protein